MSEHPDAALVRRGYEAFGKGDMDTMSSLMTADVIHHVPGNNPFSGHHKGRENVLDLYRRLGEETNGTMKADLGTVLVDGRGHVMTVHTFRADRGNRGIEIQGGLFFTIVGGKISDIDECTADIDEEDAFWS
ncbi:nuclear transport factor 2 family protein [Streptomyces sp. 12297]|uniref:nuclear transport factor 2 family protein n=1 Tax=Streptomyces sp. NBC_00239 TaxID=2903640 RepID=UPI002E2D5FEE|nr:nuclear transport factor 2 family protein [Streptomyces sp. NBC_00239]